MSNITPLLTVATHTPEMTAEDWQREIDRLFRRQQAIASVVAGRLDDDVLYDLLAEDGIDPHQWVDASIDNCEFLASGG
ncbi:hypothetical protein IQ268_30535 [Oculatella sp. LEGE 06141]|uniref:hypothetical protein n=1 Tax=Oculatella sp. LEGE 06141 TaxID=1828648 RepID=UPI0018806E20|nr:hypothetical protein [Oculatella sp. LEGE 06141]MBE9182876.1 hypothetical protein [Oculatella sp. LEGE 06141]